MSLAAALMSASGTSFALIAASSSVKDLTCPRSKALPATPNNSLFSFSRFVMSLSWKPVVTPCSSSVVRWRNVGSNVPEGTRVAVVVSSVAPRILSTLAPRLRPLAAHPKPTISTKPAKLSTHLSKSL